MQAEQQYVAPQNLSERVSDAAPQELVAMLLEGAAGFTDRAVAAIQQRDPVEKSRLVGRVSAIIEQLVTMLNYEDGGALVDNLSRIYEWWLHELFEASAEDSAIRLQRISSQMGSLKESWN